MLPEPKAHLLILPEFTEDYVLRGLYIKICAKVKLMLTKVGTRDEDLTEKILDRHNRPL